MQGQECQRLSGSKSEDSFYPSVWPIEAFGVRLILKYALHSHPLLHSVLPLKARPDFSGTGQVVGALHSPDHAQSVAVLVFKAWRVVAAGRNHSGHCSVLTGCGSSSSSHNWVETDERRPSMFWIFTGGRGSARTATEPLWFRGLIGVGTGRVF